MSGDFAHIKRLADLNIPLQVDANGKLLIDQTVEVLNQLLAIGWHIGVVNLHAHGDQLSMKGKELKTILGEIENKLDTSTLQTEGLTYRSFCRITLPADSAAGVAESLALPDLGDYNLVAVEPTSRSAVKAVVENHSKLVDLVTIVPGKSLLDWTEDSDLIQQLVKSRLPVEICYSPILEDSSVRSEALERLRPLWCEFRKGNLKLILSSHAQSKMELRGPYDIAQLGALWDVPREELMKCISATPLDVIFKKCGDVIFAKPVLDLVKALGMKIAPKRPAKDGERQKRRTKRKKKS